MTPEEHYQREIAKRGGSRLRPRRRRVIEGSLSLGGGVKCSRCKGTNVYLSEVRTSVHGQRSRTARCTKCGHIWRSISKAVLEVQN